MLGHQPGQAVDVHPQRRNLLVQFRGRVSGVVQPESLLQSAQEPGDFLAARGYLPSLIRFPLQGANLSPHARQLVEHGVDCFALA